MAVRLGYKANWRMIGEAVMVPMIALAALVAVEDHALAWAVDEALNAVVGAAIAHGLEPFEQAARGTALGLREKVFDPEPRSPASPGTRPVCAWAVCLAGKPAPRSASGSACALVGRDGFRPRAVKLKASRPTK